LPPNDRYLFSSFSCKPGFDHCCAGVHSLSYKISSSNVLAGNSFTATGVQNPVAVVPGYYVQIDTTQVQTLTFYLFASNDMGHVFSPLITVHVVCSPASTIITEAAFPTGFNEVQTVNVGTFAFFTLPAYSNTYEAKCPVN
jgi:hypothetical protein